MVSLVVAFIAFIYIIFAIIYVVLVKIFSKKKRAWLRALIFFLLLPTWDVLIAFIIYIPSAIFWSGDTIYEKVKTDTIHYDVYYDRMGVIKASENEYFYKGFKYVEMDVKIIHLLSGLHQKGLYRFWLDKNKKINYKKISKVGARYTVKYKKPIKFLIIPIKFGKMDIIDRQKNRSVASRKSVAVSYLHLFKFPFFNWLRWYDDIAEFTVYSNKNNYALKTKVINSD